MPEGFVAVDAKRRSAKLEFAKGIQRGWRKRVEVTLRREMKGRRTGHTRAEQIDGIGRIGSRTTNRFEGAKNLVFSPGIHDLCLQLDLSVAQVVGTHNLVSYLRAQETEFSKPDTGVYRFCEIC